MKRLIVIAALSGSTILPLMAQNGILSDMPIALLIILGIVVFLFLTLVLLVGNSMLQVVAKELKVSRDVNYSLLPSISEIFGSRLPKHVKDEKVIRLKKGFDIRLKGKPTSQIKPIEVSTFAIQPPNFKGLTPIPKVVVEIGSSIKAGDLLFYDKTNPNVHFVAPVSGELVEVRRGAKRSISHLVILRDKVQQYKTLSPPDLAKASKEELVAFLQESGFWPIIRQRPYNVMADSEKSPRDIFISTFDSAPLAPDNDLIVNTDGEAFQTGLDVLGKLTSGSVHLGLNAKSLTPPSRWYTEAVGVQKHWFSGAHPAGCVGVQIHHVKPIKTSDIVWTLGVQDVMLLGRIFRDKRFDTTRIIALAGAELQETVHLSTYAGANIGDLVKGKLEHSNVRLISGDVLTGLAKTTTDFIDFCDDQLTVVQEGNTYEMFGWLLPIKPRPSVSRTFPNFLLPGMTFRAETNTHGEERAFVHTGLYEEVVPMDIYPQHLIKAIMVGNIEKMEGLGIHEVVEEDLALCEFVCPSKIEVQKILRDGLDMMQEQG